MIPLLLGGTESEKREHAQAIHTLDFIKLHNTAGQWGRDHCTHFADRKMETQRIKSLVQGPTAREQQIWDWNPPHPGASKRP